MQNWIEMHDGVQLSVDRVTSGNTTVDRPSVAVAGTIQPETLREKVGALHFDTGFAARLLLAQPPVWPKVWSEAEVARDTEEAYECLLDRLYKRAASTLPLSAAAKERWIKFVNKHGERVYGMAGGVRRTIVSKEERHAARFALIVQLVRWAAGEARDEEVDAQSVDGGIRLAQWFRRETLRVFDTLELAAEAMEPEDRMLAELPSEFKIQDAYSTAHGVTERTVRNWLDSLQDRRKVQKIKRGHYIKE